MGKRISCIALCPQHYIPMFPHHDAISLPHLTRCGFASKRLPILRTLYPIGC